MAEEEEVVVPIAKHFWPKGVVRELSLALRMVADKHGNLVIVAQQAKGTIMVKGPTSSIDNARPEIRAVVEHYFPEAPVPDELWASWEWEGYVMGQPEEAEADAELLREPIEAPLAAPLAVRNKTLTPAFMGVEAAPVAPALAFPAAPASWSFVKANIEGRVKLFWKLAVNDSGGLQEQLPSAPQHLQDVAEPYVTLLFFGGRPEKKAAEKAGLSIDDFQRMNRELEAREGEAVNFTAQSIHVTDDVVFATVRLPHHIPYHGAQPYVKLRVRPDAPGDVARKVLEMSASTATKTELSKPIHMTGYIELETGDPRPNQVRAPRLADEAQGRWVHVKKHSSMGCAVVKFPSRSVRDSILERCNSGAHLHVRGIALDVKLHQEKQPDGTYADVGEALFVAWRRSAYGANPIAAEDLKSLFDRETEPWMRTVGGFRGADASDALFRVKAVTNPVQSSAAASDGDDILVLRLTRMAGSPQVTSLLLTSPLLENCRARVIAAECEVAPMWAGGAKFFVPLSKDQVEEAGLTLQQYHVIAYRRDVKLLKEVLAGMPYRQRPKLSREQQVDFTVECTLRTNSSSGALSSIVH